MEYDLFLRGEAWDFLRQCRKKEQDFLIASLKSLAKDPHRPGDFQEQDRTGRWIEGWVIKGFAIFYWPDHAVKEIKVVQIRPSDR